MVELLEQADSQKEERSCEMGMKVFNFVGWSFVLVIALAIIVFLARAIVGAVVAQAVG
tara:strand:- start:473 stop:646 length:174 start_codon:yes stop_codon:yes gene_type:complete